MRPISTRLLQLDGYNVAIKKISKIDEKQQKAAPSGD